MANKLNRREFGELMSKLAAVVSVGGAMGPGLTEPQSDTEADVSDELPTFWVEFAGHRIRIRPNRMTLNYGIEDYRNGDVVGHRHTGDISGTMDFDVEEFDA